jgi:hypothetical protein
METLNTPDEIALWISTAAGHMSTARGAYPPTAANMADAMVLELRKRIPAAGLSGEPEGHVTWRPDFSTDTMPAKVGTHWCGANEPEDSYRVISVEILDA